MTKINFRAVGIGAAAIGGLVGYAAAKEIGLGIGIAAGPLVPLLWQFCLSKEEIGKEVRNARQISGQADASAFPPASLAMMFAWFVCGALLLVYTLLVASQHNKAEFIAWMKIFQPGADWLSQLIPALGQPPSGLTEEQSNLALAVQHLLFVAWLCAPPFVLWILLDVLVLNSRTWGRSHWITDRRGWMKIVLVGVGLILLMSLPLFFGLVPASSWVDLLMLGFIGFGVFLCVFVLALACNMLLHWSDFREIYPAPTQFDHTRRLLDILGGPQARSNDR